MTVQQIKKEIQSLDLPQLQDLAAFLLQVRRRRDPERKQEIAAQIDRPKGEWISIEEFDRRTSE